MVLSKLPTDTVLVLLVTTATVHSAWACFLQTLYELKPSTIRSTTNGVFLNWTEFAPQNEGPQTVFQRFLRHATVAVFTRYELRNNVICAMRIWLWTWSYSTLVSIILGYACLRLTAAVLLLTLLLLKNLSSSGGNASKFYVSHLRISYHIGISTWFSLVTSQ